MVDTGISGLTARARDIRNITGASLGACSACSRMPSGRRKKLRQRMRIDVHWGRVCGGRVVGVNQGGTEESHGGGGARGMEKRNALGLAHASAVITAEAAEMKASPAPVMPSNDIRHLSVLAPVHRCAPNANGSSCPARPAGPLAASSALWPAASNGHNSMGGDALAHGPPVATERRATNDLVAPL